MENLFNKETEYKIYITNDYSLFKKMIGNRECLPPRIAKIIRSIKEVGLIPVPIVCNEKYEVCDGQGRLEACTELKQPVYYMIVPGLGINEVKALNINITKWSIQDYIKGYAEEGNHNFVLLLDLIEKYPELSLTSIFCAVKGTMHINSRGIKDESFRMTENEYRNAIIKLDWVKDISNIETQSSKEILISTMLYLYGIPAIDNNKLKNQVINKISLAPAWSDCLTCSMALEKIYNLRNQNKVYISSEFKKKYDENIRIGRKLAGEEGKKSRQTGIIKHPYTQNY